MNQWEYSTSKSKLPKPASKTHLLGDTFMCRSAVSPECYATEPAGTCNRSTSAELELQRMLLGSVL